MRNPVTFLGIALLWVTSLLLSGCGYSPGFSLFPIPRGGGGGPIFSTVTFNDFVGDATVPAAGATAWDITQVTTSRLVSNPTTLTVNITMAQAISSASLPAVGSKLTSPTQLGVSVLISTGASGNSVTPKAGSCTGNPTFPSVAFSLDPGMSVARLADGNFAILNAASANVGEAAVSFTPPNTLSYAIPISAIGGGSGAVGLAVIAADGVGTTDCAPDAGFLQT